MKAAITFCLVVIICSMGTKEAMAQELTIISLCFHSFLFNFPHSLFISIINKLALEIQAVGNLIGTIANPAAAIRQLIFGIAGTILNTKLERSKIKRCVIKILFVVLAPINGSF